MTVSKLNLSSEPQVDQYTLVNESKTLAVIVLNYGGIISHILTPDKQGQIRDIVLGFDDYESYQSPYNPYFGAVIGRYANRIGNGQFTLNGNDYSLLTNNGPNALHGGEKGFDKNIWDVEILSEQRPASIRLTLISKDGDQGYPGTLKTQVTYSVNNDNTLTIDYYATLLDDDTSSTTSTIVNLTNHTYFNLSGVALNPTILNTCVSMTDNIKGFLELDENNLPTGKEISLKDQPCMDFTGELAGTTIGKRIDELKTTRGYDHPYILHHQFKPNTSELPLQQAFIASSPETGIELTFATTEPCFQFYTGNWIASDHMTSKKSQDQIPIGQHAGFCLESSRFPDAPNKPHWRSSVLLQKNDVYASKTVFTFKTKKD